MAADFPIVDRNRYVNKAAKAVLDAQSPGNWIAEPLDGENDFGFDYLVYVDVNGGVQYTFFLQLKGTEHVELINEGTQIAFRLKRRTLNLYANTVPDVMLAVAEVVLDSAGKVIHAESKIHWEWLSKQLIEKRGGTNQLDFTGAETQTVHVPVDQLLHDQLRVETHLQQRVEATKLALSLEEILRRVKNIGGSQGQPTLDRLLSAAQARPEALVAFILGSEAGGSATWPEAALEIRAFLRAGSTAQAEEALVKLGNDGFGSTPFLKALFLSQKGKTLVQRGQRDRALGLFEQAYATDGTEENLLPLAEMKFLKAVDSEDKVAIRETLALLTGAESDDGLSLRVRGYVSLNELAEAELCQARITDRKKTLSQVVLLSGQRRFHDAVDAAIAAELDTDLSVADLASVQLVAARAAWSGATAEVTALNEANELPLSGALGTDLALAEKAWAMAKNCLDSLRSIGWPPNVEVLAPVICGVAGMLGRQEEAIRLFGDAPARRPEYIDLQHNFELLAIGASDAELALSANLRQPERVEVLIRRTNLLFELRRFDECQVTALKVARWEGEPHKNTPLALAIGFAAAHKVGRLAEAKEISDVLSKRPEWAAFAAFAEFARRGTLDQKSPSPAEALRDGLAVDPDSWLLVANLFLNLNVNDEESAQEAIELAKKLKTRALLSVDETQRLVAAHATLAQWQESAGEAANGLTRFKGDERLLAMAAVAEEMLGHTGRAMSMLESVVEAGTSRIAAVHNFMGLAFRLGRTDSVRKAIDRLLELQSGRTERLELLRLSALVYYKQGEHAKSHQTARGLGELVDSSIEEEEGMLVNVVMAVTITGPKPDEEFLVWARARVDAFCERWPASRIFRRVRLPEHGLLDLDDLHEAFDSVGGDSRARLAGFESRERRARAGELPIPFTVRPGFVFHYIGDAFTLWEAAKASRYDDHQFHLSIAFQGAEPKSPDATRDTPLIDLAALLVVDSLGLFSALFKVFERVAISRATVGYISQQANGVLASGVGAETATRILALINHHLDRIDQPGTDSAPKGEELTALHVMREFNELAKRGSYVAYCDDAILRAMVHAEDRGVRFCTSLDVMEILDLQRELSPATISLKLAALVEWNVGIFVSDRQLIASLDGAVPSDFHGGAARLHEHFIAHRPFVTLSRAIWDGGKSANDLITHMGNLLRSMMSNQKTNTDAVAAVLACWFGRVRWLRQTAGLDWMLACFPVLIALLGLPKQTGSKLVSILQQAVEICVGEQSMSMSVENDVIRELATIVGRLSYNNADVGRELMERLTIALPVGTATGDIFQDAFTAGFLAASSPKAPN